MDWLTLDPLDATQIRDQARTHTLGREIEVVRRLVSTNDRVRDAAARGRALGFTVLAEEQTAGRGRRGRRWHGVAGHGLALSCLLGRAGIEPGVFTLAMALGVRQGILQTTGVEPHVKWPNDLHVGRKKLCGILVEALPGELAVVGLGINVHPMTQLPDALRASATCLDAVAGRATSRTVLAARVLESVEEVWARARGGGGAGILDDWRQATVDLGARVCVETGGDSWEGIVVDIDETGALLVQVAPDHVERILAGSVRVLASAGEVG